MARYEDLPFARGETYFNGGTIDISDLTSIGGENLEGREYEIDDNILADANAMGVPVRLKIVRNMSATAVTAKQLLKYDTTDKKWGFRVNGISDAAALRVAVADRLLPSGGVPQYDLFYVVTRGPTLINSPAGTPTISAGSGVVSATTGKGGPQDLTGATALLANQVQNRIGTALQALTSGQTNTDFIVGVGW